MSRYIAKCQEKKIEDYQSEGTKYWQKFFFIPDGFSMLPF